MPLPRPTECRPWGEYQDLLEGEGFKVKIIEVRPGARNSLQRHALRAEHWVVIRGEGFADLGGRRVPLAAGTQADVPLGMSHRFTCTGAGPLLILELQRGTECSEDDIERIEDDYGRAAL